MIGMAPCYNVDLMNIETSIGKFVMIVFKRYISKRSLRYTVDLFCQVVGDCAS